MSSPAIASSSASPIESTQSTTPKPFNATPHMYRWLDTVISNPTPVVEEISRKSGVDESTYYSWLKKEGFLEWFETERQKRLRAFSWRLDNMGMKRAGDDYRYWEGMQKRVGNFKETNNIAAEFKDGDKSMRFVISREA
jgi:hypothetical protein